MRPGSAGALLSVMLIAAIGCASSSGRVGMLGRGEPDVAVQRLRPGATAGACSTSILGFPAGGSGDPLAAAVGRVLEFDRDGDVLIDAEVEWRALTTGLYNRECVVVRGDIGRVVPRLVLPTPEGHRHHH